MQEDLQPVRCAAAVGAAALAAADAALVAIRRQVRRPC